MPEVHLKYGGSTMARTVACTGWQAAAKGLPNTASDAADRGSCLHDLVEICINDEKDPREWLNFHHDKWDYTVDEDDVLQLESAIKQFNEVMDQLELDEWVTEEFVQIDELVGGSADVVAAGMKNCAIIDWKFGYHEVSAEKSWQGATYLLSAESSKATEELLHDRDKYFVIIQPKVSDTPSIYQYTPDELDQMFTTIDDAVTASEEGEGTLVGGEHCLFCPAAPTCPQKILVAAEAKELSDFMQPEQAINLEQALALAEELEPWCKAVKNFGHEMIEKGAAIPGWKLVDKRAMRKWVNAEEAQAKAKGMRRLKQEEWADIKMKTAPALEKVCKSKGINFEKEFGAMVEKKSSGTTLARDDDPRGATVTLTQGDVTDALKQLESM